MRNLACPSLSLMASAGSVCPSECRVLRRLGQGECYLYPSASLVITLPDPSLQATVGLSNTVALDFGRALFGPVGGAVFAAMVAFSCFGALNGTDLL